MKRTSTVVSALVIALSATALGCSKEDEKNPPTREEADEVSTTTASLVSANDGQTGEVRAMADAVALVKGETPSGMSLSAEGSFEFNRGGLRYSYNVSCFDAANAPIACGPDADGGTLTVAWDGSYDGIWIDGSAQRSGEWTLRGVQGNNPVLSGQGSFDLAIDYSSLDGRRQSSYDLAFDATYSDVRFDRALGRPVGGSIRYEVEATRTASGPNRDANAQFDATAVVTFTPDGASLSIDKDYTYDLDLKTGQATPRAASPAP
ncbi:MAG TPA: hypothetical protein VFS43_13090 [Polyangiaceae bacterium]|nr:hypothetical protein [Polyangiaceae bacterium]